MSNIRAAFDKKKSMGRKAFIPFITAGDPGIEATEEFIYALERAGSDVIEIGVPFSDPTADGPVIQNANIRALEKGTTIQEVFELVEKVRKNTKIPLVFLLYANIVYHYGIEAFFKRCQEVGLDGIILPDVPVEEKEEFANYAVEYDIDLIVLVAPTSHKRTEKILETATGFVYCVSSLGVTGTRSEIQTDLQTMFEEIDKYTNIPTALGFGISNKEQAVMLKDYADGIIVGSAAVKIIEKYGVESAPYLESFAKEIIEAI